MTTLEDEAKIEREQGKLARNMIACLRSLYFNSVKEILPFSQNYSDSQESLTIQIYQELTAGIFSFKSSFTVFLISMMI